MYINAYWNTQVYAVQIESRTLSPNVYQLTLTFPDGKTVQGTGPDFFDAILQIRTIIEPHGWLLGINASRLDVGKHTDFNNPHEELVTLVHNRKIQYVHALDAAELSQVGAIEYQTKFFREKYTEAVKFQQDRALIRKETKEANKADKNRHMPVLAPLLAFISSFYPLTFQFLNFSNLTVIYGWALIGLLVYGIVIGINLEDMLISRRTTIGLIMSIVLPFIVTITYFYVVFLIKGAEFADAFTTFAQ